MVNNILEIQNLSVSYENSIILHNFNLPLKIGESYCLVGKNGSGKSTFLKSVIGLIKPQTGKIIFNEIDITHTTIHERVQMGISYLGQNNNIFARLKVFEHFNLVKSRNKDILEELIPEILKLKNSYAGNLSGGEQRLLGLSLILLQEKKKLLLLDELFAGVDNQFKIKITNILNALIETKKITTFIVEQDEEIIKQFNINKINIK